MSARFKVIVMCNGGGGIFRFIGSTSSLPELDRFFAGPVRLPLRDIASGYGLAYFEAAAEAELGPVLHAFSAEPERPALLAVTTPPETSARVLRAYFSRR